ncbi:FAM72 protein-domain-containing protein [Zychaea mexicana]|uniref:FAM72 protein-domain-containing protein n=1 Tax=Zychaea mexicana TaxID=64656 RepID=UPI0022FF048A|nr:FAM72 protein-domain-containing protein [Zychaea mexicana]KAI9491472.1 FAM72 protein-domain-containing protein [Zychaea mexicana]
MSTNNINAPASSTAATTTTTSTPVNDNNTTLRTSATTTSTTTPPTSAVRGSAVAPLKPVYRLLCKHCRTIVCARGMRAILLADTKIELYSTDIPATSIQLMDKDYLTRTCHCRIRDVACRDCGNIIGYHVVAPCHRCLQAGNNGHFWMFHSDACQPQERKDISGKRTVLWNNLPRAEQDFDFLMGTTIPYDQMCR